ncbi:MAG: hypothetical protein MMC23_008714 [Stictis urceolatum]|nr:hypothetical protein [Stictis urceolata]
MATVQQPPNPAHELSSTFESSSPANAPKFRTNNGGYIDSDVVGWLKPTPKDTPVEEMRRRYEADGYLWVKNVIPREDVYDMREHYFQTISPTKILAPNASPRAGIFNSALDPLEHQGLGGTPPKSTEAILDFAHTTPEYKQFLAHPSLRAFVRHLSGWKKELLLERGLLRHNAPGSLSTGVHYDQLFLRGGPPEYIAAWVPIGDCVARGGGLMYLEESSEIGRATEEEFRVRAEEAGFGREEMIFAFNRHMGKNGFLCPDAGEYLREVGRGPGGRRWLVADYEAGDVVFHGPWMVHGSTGNEDVEGKIRLSTDLRFYEEGEKIDERWMKPFFHGDGL